MKIHLFVLASLLLSGTALADPETEQVLEGEKKLVRALKEEDAESLAPLLDERFQAVMPDGTRDDRTGHLDSLNKRFVCEEIHESDVRVTIYNHDTAIVSGVWVIRGQTHGREIEVPRVFTHVWVREEGEWKLVSRQLSPKTH